MKPRSAIAQRIAMAVVILLVVAGCTSSAEPDKTTNRPFAQGASSTTLATTTSEPYYDGPCYDSSGILTAGTAVLVNGVSASFGHSFHTYCPDSGVDSGGIAGDGFLHDIDSRIVSVEPGEVLDLAATGYPGATVAATWIIHNTTESWPAPLTSSGEGIWTVVAPEAEHTYRLHVGLGWSTGEASYGVTVIVGDATEPVLLAVEPVGEPTIHPTLLPSNLAPCDPGEAELRFCDLDSEHHWLEIDIEPAGLLNTGTSHFEYSRIPGAMQLTGPGSAVFGTHLSADRVLTVSASGIGHTMLIDIAASIPAFEPEPRAEQCTEIAPADLPSYQWMCELQVSLPMEFTERELLRFSDGVGTVPVLYRFRPIVGGLDRRLRIGPSDDLVDVIAEWRIDMNEAAEAVGFDAGLAEPGAYLIDELLMWPAPQTDPDHWARMLSRLEDDGFEFEMGLRQHDWHEY